MSFVGKVLIYANRYEVIGHLTRHNVNWANKFSKDFPLLDYDSFYSRNSKNLL